MGSREQRKESREQRKKRGKLGSIEPWFALSNFTNKRKISKYEFVGFVFVCG